MKFALILVLAVILPIIECKLLRGNLVGLVGKPLYNFVIEVDGVERTKSDEKGQFVIDIEGTATLTVNNKLNHFKPLVVNAANMRDEENLPEWRSKGVSLCGGIVMFD